MDSPFDPALLRRFGSSPEEARARLETELQRLSALLPRLEGCWTERPKAGAWVPAQVVEHVMKANDATSKVLHLLRRDASLPEPTREPGRLKDGKPQAPAGLEPGEPRPYAEVLEAWEHSTARFLSEVAQTTDWQGRRFFHPFFGDLCAHEWVQAMSFHNAHHRKDLERTFLEPLNPKP